MKINKPALIFGILLATTFIAGVAIGTELHKLHDAEYPTAELVIVGVDGDDNLTGSDIQPLSRTSQIEYPVPANTTEIHITFSH